MGFNWVVSVGLINWGVSNWGGSLIKRRSLINGGALMNGGDSNEWGGL